MDTNAYQEGALDVKSKELIDLPSFRFYGDCVKYHLGKCKKLVFQQILVCTKRWSCYACWRNDCYTPPSKSFWVLGRTLQILDWSMFQRDLDLERKWQVLLSETRAAAWEKKPKDLNGVLFVIGLQKAWAGSKLFSKKEEKQDLMHIAICKVLSLAGYYELEGLDADGWPPLEIG